MVSGCILVERIIPTGYYSQKSLWIILINQVMILFFFLIAIWYHYNGSAAFIFFLNK